MVGTSLPNDIPRSVGEVELHCDDAVEFLRNLPDNSVDSIVTDPPYNVGYKYDSTDDHRADYADWCGEWLKECLRVSRWSVMISCGHTNLGMWYRISEPRWLACWWKPAAMGNSPFGVNNWEPMLFYGKVPKRTKCDVIRATITAKDHLSWHPCPKPVGWARGFVKATTMKGMTVLDPFLGSGTTGVACVQLGRKFVGVEIDPGYFGKAKERILAARLSDDFGL